MARSDRANIASILDRARRIALDIEERTSIVPIPQPDEARERLAHYDGLISDQALRKATRSLYASQHYVQAVTEAYKLVNNTVKKKAGTAEKDGASMMMAVFDSTKPILRLNAGKTTSQRD